MPVLNEAESLKTRLDDLQHLREAGHELIVVDGGSQDDSMAVARPLADQVISGPQGRSLQMNVGAQQASGGLLLFLHADTSLPENASRLMLGGLIESQRPWGRFDVRLSGGHIMFRIIERIMNWRSRLSGIATGDQAIFVSRWAFEQVGGFPAIALMEDIAISKRLKRLGRPLCLSARVVTSSRRWEAFGIWRTILLMWRLRLAYFLGADPQRLAGRYRGP